MFLKSLFVVLLVSTAFSGSVSAAANADANQASYWGTNCTKTEMNGNTTYFTAPAGATKVIVKGGTDNKVYTQAPFTNLTAPINPKNGQPYGISHVIVCTDAVTTTTTNTTSGKNNSTEAGKGGGQAVTVSADTTPDSLPSVGNGLNAVVAVGLLTSLLGYFSHRRVAVRQYA